MKSCKVKINFSKEIWRKANPHFKLGVTMIFKSNLSLYLTGRRFETQTSQQARSQDLKKGRGGFFKRVRKLQTTLTQIFIVLESESHGLSKNWDGISRKIRKFKPFFSPKTGDLQKQKQKKRSSPKLRRIFWPLADIQTLFQAESRHVLHNFGTHFPLGEAAFIFSPKIGLKSTKNARFCILHRPMGRLEPPAPPGYATASRSRDERGGIFCSALCKLSCSKNSCWWSKVTFVVICAGKINWIKLGSPSAVATGGGRLPHNDCLCPHHFGLTRILFWSIT